jgi:hypothetical protein
MAKANRWELVALIVRIAGEVVRVILELAKLFGKN